MTKWTAQILTLFPEMFPGPLGSSLAGKALQDGLWNLKTINIRDYATDNHKTVDDTPFGGGAGMVMRPDVIEKALLANQPSGHFIYLTPRGALLTQDKVKELIQKPLVTILCGRYEGVDQRVIEAHNAEEISIGDYVLSGGEPAAMILIDACVRLLPGVMGNEDTAGEESFEGGLLEYPHFTRPAEWVDNQENTRKVPEILTSGHHQRIKEWRKAEAEAITRIRRPDLWRAYQDKSGRNKGEPR